MMAAMEGRTAQGCSVLSDKQDVQAAEQSLWQHGGVPSDLSRGNWLRMLSSRKLLAAAPLGSAGAFTPMEAMAAPS